MSYQLIRLSAGLEMRVDIPGRLILVDSVSTGQGVDIALVRNGTPAPYIPGRQAGFRLVEDFGGVLLRSALDCEVGIFLAINDVHLGGTAGGAVVIPSGVNVTNDLAHSVPVTLTSSSNTTPIPVSLASIRVNNTPEQAIPVLFSGTVAPVLGVVTVDNTNAEAIPVKQQAGAVFESQIKNTDATAVPVVQKAGAVFESQIKNTDATAVPVVQKAGAIFTVEQATEVDTRDYLAATVENVAPVAVSAVAAVLLAASGTRRGARLKNAGDNAVAIGGANIVFATAAVLIQPGETWNENEAPGAAWYCICDAGLVSKINIQTIT
nr:hypothetical protein [uncultured Janthinobacterium sp.]